MLVVDRESEPRRPRFGPAGQGGRAWPLAIGESGSFALTLAMVGMASLHVELATAEPERPPVVSAAWAAGLIALAVLGGGLCRRVERGHARSAGEPSVWVVIALLGAFALPFLAQPVRIALGGRARMPELLMLDASRNVMLCLGALSHHIKLSRLAALTSLFLVITASGMAEGAWVTPVMVLYATAGCLWLMCGYWIGARCPTMRAPRRFPLATLAVLLFAIGVVAAAAAYGPERAATVLAGLLHTSGGTDGSDPEARSGVNDGDNEVKASKRPESVGFTDSEVYLESDRPSLYDAFSETYGEPFKQRKQERMIALAPNMTQERRERPSENLRAGREFSTVRRQPNVTRRPSDRAAAALVYVKGVTPLHLPLATYDHFDGVNWREEPHCQQACPLEPCADHWLRVTTPDLHVFRGTVSHQIKIGALSSGPLSAPAHLVRFRVGRVDQVDFFGWAQYGIVRMLNRTVPAGTVIDTEARLIDRRGISGVNTYDDRSVTPSRYGIEAGDPEPDPRVAALVARWTRGVAPGWAQVEAVVAALRREYAHDRRLHRATRRDGCRGPLLARVSRRSRLSLCVGGGGVAAISGHSVSRGERLVRGSRAL